MNENRHIVVFGGAGSSGSVLAWKLKRAGYDVTIIDPNIDALRDNGGITLSFKGDDAGVKAEFAATKLLTPEQLDLVKKPDLVISVTKAFDLDEELGAQLKQVAGDATVLELTNGLKGERDTDFTDTVGDNLVLGVLEDPATITAYGTQVLVLESRLAEAGISVGNDSGVDIAVVDEVFKAAGIGFKAAKPTREVIFNKLSSILSIGIQAAFDAKYSEVADPATDLGKYTEATIREYHAIANSAGVDLGDVDQFVEEQRVIMQGKKDSKGTLLSSILAGEQTENEAIYGELVKLGDDLEQDTTLLQQIKSLVDVMEKQGIKDKEESRHGARKDGLTSMRADINCLLVDADGNYPVEKFRKADFSQVIVRDGDHGGVGVDKGQESWVDREGDAEEVRYTAEEIGKFLVNMRGNVAFASTILETYGSVINLNEDQKGLAGSWIGLGHLGRSGPIQDKDRSLMFQSSMLVREVINRLHISKKLDAKPEVQQKLDSFADALISLSGIDWKTGKEYIPESEREIF